MRVNLADGLAEGLAGEEVVAQIDRIEPGVARAVHGEPGLGGGVLAGLFFGSVLRRNELEL